MYTPPLICKGDVQHAFRGGGPQLWGSTDASWVPIQLTQIQAPIRGATMVRGKFALNGAKRKKKIFLPGQRPAGGSGSQALRPHPA